MVGISLLPGAKEVVELSQLMTPQAVGTSEALIVKARQITAAAIEAGLSEAAVGLARRKLAGLRDAARRHDDRFGAAQAQSELNKLAAMEHVHALASDPKSQDEELSPYARRYRERRRLA